MADLDRKMLDLTKKRRTLKQRIASLFSESQRIEEDLKLAEMDKRRKGDDAEEYYLESKQAEITENYSPAIAPIEAEIAKFKDELGNIKPDESEELKEARKAQEYLNSAAIKVHDFYSLLTNKSSSYLVDLAYNEEIMELNKFKKVFKSLDDRTKKINSFDAKEPIPFRWISKAKKNLGSISVSIYVIGILASPAIAVTFPFAVVKSVRRARYIHESSGVYHSLMHSLASLSQKTDKEVSDIFKTLLRLKTAKLERGLRDAEEHLRKILKLRDEEIEALSFDREAFDDDLARTEKQLELKLLTIREELETLEEQLAEVEMGLKELMQEKEGELERERNTFLYPREVREVVLPKQLLYDYDDQVNKKYTHSPGLFLYTDRQDVEDYILSTVYQLRNIMQWNTIQFRILDLLDSSFISPLELPQEDKAKSQDIHSYTLADEREEIIKVTHDLLRRRGSQILKTESNIDDYNLIQIERDSPPAPYQMLYYITNKRITMNEKLIQICYTGERVGINLTIFMKSEQVDSGYLKEIGDYFKRVVELSSSGLTSYPVEDYYGILLLKEKEKKS